MNRKVHSKKILTTALLTAALVVGLNAVALPVKLCSTYGCDGIMLLLILMAINLIASIPGLFLMKYQKVPYAVAITFIAVLEAFWLSYALVPLLMPISWWTWMVAASCLLVLSYLFADFLFNKWIASSRRKFIVALLLVALTALVSDRVVTLVLAR